MIKLFIDGTVYDVTDFIKKHPGGSVIKYYANSDATAAFNEFHYRSKSAKKILQSLPIVTEKNDTINYPKNKELLTDFYILKQKLVNMGYFKPSISHVTYRGLEIALLFLLQHLDFISNYSILSLPVLFLESQREDVDGLCMKQVITVLQEILL